MLYHAAINHHSLFDLDATMTYLKTRIENSGFHFRTLFSAAWRLFFLTAINFAIVEMLLLIISQLQGAGAYHPIWSRHWHERELVFGYAGAFFAGYLLTAVRNWTGIAEPQAKMLIFLLALWLLARVFPLFPGEVFNLLSSTIEVMFFAVVTALVASSLIQKQRRNSYVFIELLSIFILGNVLTHWAQLGWWIESDATGLRLSLYSAIAMLIILSGRVLPFSIQKSFNPEKPASPHAQLMETVALLAIYGLMIVETLLNMGWLAGLISLIAAIALGVRISSFYHPDIRHHSLLWMEFSGLLWIMTGFIFHAAAGIGLIVNDAGLPVLALGGIGIISTAMMVRVIQGHTGSNLQENSDITAAFYLLNIGTLSLVTGIVAAENIGNSLILISELCWVLAFAFLLKACGPLLLKPSLNSVP